LNHSYNAWKITTLHSSPGLVPSLLDPEAPEKRGPLASLPSFAFHPLKLIFPLLPPIAPHPRDAAYCYGCHNDNGEHSPSRLRCIPLFSFCHDRVLYISQDLHAVLFCLHQDGERSVSLSPCMLVVSQHRIEYFPTMFQILL
jgi:hypothetical protein